MPVIGDADPGLAAHASGMCPPRQQPRRRIEPDPAGSGQIHFAPGVKIGEILRDAPDGPSSDTTSGLSWMR